MVRLLNQQPVYSNHELIILTPKVSGKRTRMLQKATKSAVPRGIPMVYKEGQFFVIPGRWRRGLKKCE